MTHPPAPTSYAELARDIARVARQRRVRLPILSAVLGTSPDALIRLGANPDAYGGNAAHLAGMLARWAEYCAALPPIRAGRPGRAPFGETAADWERLCGGWRATLIAECRKQPVNAEGVDFTAADLTNGLEVLEMCRGGA